MSGVNLSGVIGRLSIYCKPTCTRVFIFGDRGRNGLVEYISIALAAMDSD